MRTNSPKPSKTREIRPIAIDCSSASATALNRAVRTLRPSLKIGVCVTMNPRTTVTSSDLSETIDRPRAQKENEQEGRNHYGARPDHRATARDSDPDEKGDCQRRTAPNFCRHRASGPPRPGSQCQGEIRDHSHDK